MNLVLLGELEEMYLEKVAKEIERVFRIKVKILERREVPLVAFNPLRKQFKADLILELLEKEYREKTLGIIDQDLYTEGLNFIFGQAQLNGKVGIVSTFRLDPRFYNKMFDEKLFLERLKKEALHEVGHIFGLMHCENLGCFMHFSNSILEVDEKGSELCEKCRKLLEKKFKSLGKKI